MHPIRQATATDLPLLPAIERAAASLFLQTPYPQLADGPLASEHIDPSRDRTWVVVDATDAPLGFVIARLLSDSVHIQEIDVHPAHARHGLGRQLIEHVVRWARARAAPALTLTTFDDVPWNGPYYSRLGFRIVSSDSLSAELKAVRQAEEASGLPMAHRICMKMML